MGLALSSTGRSTAAAPTMSNSQSPKLRSFIEAEHSTHTVVVWSKTYCPYCSQTKTLLTSLPNLSRNEIQVHELDQHPQGDAIQRELYAMSGQRTVPNVFVRGQHLGGNDDTHRAHRSGQLTKLLRPPPVED
jgi:glutaredoxin 3